MSDLSKWAKKNPAFAALFRDLVLAVLMGHTADTRQQLLSRVAELDSDGDGEPDATDPDPNNPAVKSPKPRAKKKVA